MTNIIMFIAAIFILLGTFISIVASIGVIRLPNVYTRNHAASKSTTLAAMLILTGAFLYFYAKDNHFNAALLLGIGFIFLTAPVAGHLISRAAYNSGIKLWEKSVRDDLYIVRLKQQQRLDEAERLIKRFHTEDTYIPDVKIKNDSEKNNNK